MISIFLNVNIHYFNVDVNYKYKLYALKVNAVRIEWNGEVAMMHKKELGNQIWRFRNANKMTLAVMSERIGVTKSAIAAYENGSRTPSVDVLIKIARLFHVTTDNLLGHTNRDLIDVTELSPEQRSSVQEMISSYEKYNEAVDILRKNELLDK